MTNWRPAVLADRAHGGLEVGVDEVEHHRLGAGRRPGGRRSGLGLGESSDRRQGGQRRQEQGRQPARRSATPGSGRIAAR